MCDDNRNNDTTTNNNDNTTNDKDHTTNDNDANDTNIIIITLCYY